MMEFEESTEKSKTAPFHNHAASFASSSAANSDASCVKENEDEIELQWAAIERLPTFRRLRLSLFDEKEDDKGEEGQEGGRRHQA
ncbi:hypothetical protein OIU79_016515 [Salix purpurea]|uniref:Uncharacterized protein n=1 Tax=Salix purpurea TaxID=77065 RepID=A0A9Q0SR90_SALPP|nr:hypothetical protein OIU79_016515 [Salix purpurea]